MGSRAIIFDYFGVIRPDTLRAAYQRMGGDPDADAQFIADTCYASNRGHLSSAKIFAAHLGITEAQWMEAVNGGVVHDDELLAYIAQLGKQYKIGLLSNVGKGRLPIIWEGDDRLTLFHAVRGSGDLGCAKPDPEIFLHMAEALGVPPEDCVMVDDQPVNCEGAKVVGMQALCYKSFAQFQQEFEKLTAVSQYGK